jgi:tRNA A37 threonylcarbamoyltransferase TsaD
MTPDNIIDLRDDSVKEKNRKQIPEWEIKLEHDTRQMIETFEEQGLMDKKLPLSRAVFRRKTRSKMHGTKTMIDRALANGIINTQQTDINEPLELYQYICMSLQNDHPEVFSDKRRRKIAVKKVQKLVDDYFTGKKSNQR